ncbi:putative phospholipase d nuclease [Diaporthe ampelina]|uniref:Putative phospholipase d nuclease n=1 Tax=Diaporthe ampelina TaxID=1214573 RepID=A0A0G2I9N1_9PEZI|nr:putative phospholipase d nuclease [Diaporthe ampelina]
METFTLGTGASIYTQKLLPAISQAQHEIILVTCFWAPSKTLTALSSALERLARQRAAQQPAQPLRVRICFSSRSILQKLSHTSSADGYVYPPSSWSSKLGLPVREVLAAGNMQLEVKSLFFLPFSVMHPKFLIVDRQRAFVPSCNVSWEAWLEGCLEISRRMSRDDPVDGLLEFYHTVWDKELDLGAPQPPIPEHGSGRTSAANDRLEETIKSPADSTASLVDIDVPATAVEWLPGWHHRNPSFCFLPWRFPLAPDTPLNTTILRLLLSAVEKALARGVDVTIVTSRRMMLLEQIVTAGVLRIFYFRSRAGLTSDEEPVHSHLKLSIFDGQHTVLGSGNMDRASWFTSQELGVLVRGAEFATTIKKTVDEALDGRLDPVFTPS